MKKISFTMVILILLLCLAGCGKQPTVQNAEPEGMAGNSQSEAESREVYRDHIRYTAGNDGLTVIGYIGEETELEIPSEVDGMPVVRIQDAAFLNESLISRIVLAEGIREIGTRAFTNCEGLETIEIPASVTAIGDRAFAGCTSLKEISISASNSAYRFDDGGLFSRDGTLLHSYIPGKGRTFCSVPEGVTRIGSYSFALCDGLERVVLPDTLREIEEGAFFMCTSLREVNLPYGLTAIGDSAFLFCKSLEQAVIPGTVTAIGSEAFSQCSRLVTFKVADDNENYVFEDGVLFNRDKTRLCAYMQTNRRETYTVPEGVTEIGEKAFSSCTALKTVVLPDSLKTIGDGAFEDCSALEQMVIPDGVAELRSRTFSGCVSLKNLVIPDSVVSFDERIFGVSRNDILSRSQGLVLTVGENSAALEYAEAAKIDVEIK